MDKLHGLFAQALEQQLLRPLDVAFARLVAEKPAQQLIAAWVSAESGVGHSCLALDALRCERLFSGRAPALAAACWQQADMSHPLAVLLADWPALGNGEQPTPLVLQNRHLYLHRLWRNEGRVAHFFAQTQATAVSDPQRLRAILDALFGTARDNWQKVAAAVALTRRISVISGGPGTGKTTTVARILAALLQLHTQMPRIQLAAPTGKAAARLTQALSRVLPQLALSKQQRVSFPLEAVTLHRLLGAQMETQRLRYHADNLLNLDILVVDEASMVDLAMMAKLIAALPAQARVIFLGDHDQLASVEVGSVLGDLCRDMPGKWRAARAAELGALTGCDDLHGTPEEGAVARWYDSVCLLRRSWRFHATSGIGRLAQCVNRGECGDEMSALLTQFADVNHYTCHDNHHYQAMINRLVLSYRAWLTNVTLQRQPGMLLTELNHFQVLCAVREGPFGVVSINRCIEQQLVACGAITFVDRNSTWYHGRPVMIVRNDDTLELMNGDIGVTLAEDDGALRIWFQLPDGRCIRVPPSRLPPHETAWAMTVHKAQGSEFDHVALVLPDNVLPVLRRELIYTAITRARHKLSLYTSLAVFCQAIKARTERSSGLMARLTGLLETEFNHE